MNNSILTQLSDNIKEIVALVGPRLAHIGGENIPFRTGIRLDDGLIVTTAMSAEDGDAIEVRFSDGTKGNAVVKAFDARRGIALLATDTKRELVGWESEQPFVGMLAVTVAFASGEGVESRLDLVRCAGEGYFQTDGSPYPGFSGSAVVSSTGKLLGMVESNAHGNHGNVLPYADLSAIVESLKTRGSTKRRVLGLRTHPVAEGLLVVEVMPGSASSKAEIRVGDILISLNASELKDPLSLIDTLQTSTGEVEITLDRGGNRISCKAVPEEKAETVTRGRAHSGCCGNQQFSIWT
jgi:serine protease DegQ